LATDGARDAVFDFARVALESESVVAADLAPLSVEVAGVWTAARRGLDEGAPATLKHRLTVDGACVGALLFARVAGCAERGVAIEVKAVIHGAATFASAMPPERELARGTDHRLCVVRGARVVSRRRPPACVALGGDAVVAALGAHVSMRGVGCGTASPRTFTKNLAPKACFACQRAVVPRASNILRDAALGAGLRVRWARRSGEGECGESDDEPFAVERNCVPPAPPGRSQDVIAADGRRMCVMSAANETRLRGSRK
jgi:hypothetical protein